MKLEIPNCPICGEPAKGTLETITGVAEFEPSEDGGVQYSGYTKVWWDEQKTPEDGNGRCTLICHQGHDWQSKIEEEVVSNG